MAAPQSFLETRGGNPGENSHEGLTIPIEKLQPEKRNKTPLFQEAQFTYKWEMWMVTVITDLESLWVFKLKGQWFISL